MTDLHTHILPGMDDGAKDLASALTLLHMQSLQGVRNVALTSHYCADRETPDAFILRRERAFAELRPGIPEGICVKVGCEVFFTPDLLRMDVRPLCLEGTQYLLLELPLLQRPAFFQDFLCSLRMQGIIPVIAHAERYLYVQKNPALLKEWISCGALIQVNSGSLTGASGKFVCKLIKWGLVHVLASDAHNADYRPPDLRQGLNAAARKLGADKLRELAQNAEYIYYGENIRLPLCHSPKRFLGFWI